MEERLLGINWYAMDLAKCIVTKCVKENHPITNFQLQKILYFIQLRHIRLTGYSAFLDELEAWQWGPVIPDLYYYFGKCGALPILDTYEIEEPDEPLKEIADYITKTARQISPFDLMAITNVKGGPWDIVFNKRMGNRDEYNSDIIPYELLRDYAISELDYSKTGHKELY